MPLATHNAAWQEEPRGQVHNALARVWHVVADESEWQYDADEYHLDLYAGAAGAMSLRRASRRGYTYGPNTLPYNICRSAVDTVVAKIAQHRPLPQVLANRGSWTDQQRAKKCTQFLEGQCAASKLFEKHGKLVVRDAAIFSRGLMYVWHESGQIVIERTYPWEVYADPWDAHYGDPRTRFRLRTMDRQVAVARYATSEEGRVRPTVRDAILSAGRLDTRRMPEMNQTVDTVEVLEAWRRPDGPNSGPGRYVGIVEGATLWDKDWVHDFFPFAEMFYSDPVTGNVGQGLVELLEGFQCDINTMACAISESYRLLGNTIILTPSTAKILSSEFRNEIGKVVVHEPGGVPTVFQPAPVHPDVYRRLHDMGVDALNEIGVSQMSARAQTPTGITAGVALQAVDDSESERMILFGRSFESLCLQAGRLMIAANQEIAAEGGEMSVKVPMKGTLLDLKWSDVRVDEFDLRVFPTSSLPQQRGARLDMLKMLWDVGQIDRLTFLQQLDMPDLQAETDLQLAGQLLAEDQIEYLQEAPEGDERAPSVLPIPEMDLDWVLRRVKLRICQITIQLAPGYVLQRLRDYEQTVIAMQKLANPPPPPPPAPDAGPLPAPGMGAPPGPEMGLPPQGPPLQ